MKFNVQNIPDEFAYLRDATKRYGHLSHHNVILHFLETKTERDMERLRAAATEIVARNDARAICAWINQVQEEYGPSDRPRPALAESPGGAAIAEYLAQVRSACESEKEQRRIDRVIKHAEKIETA